MEAEEFKKQLDRLAARLTRIEQVLQLSSPEGERRRVEAGAMQRTLEPGQVVRETRPTSVVPPPIPAPPTAPAPVNELAAQEEEQAFVEAVRQSAEITISQSEKAASFQRLQQSWSETPEEDSDLKSASAAVPPPVQRSWPSPVPDQHAPPAAALPQPPAVARAGHQQQSGRSALAANNSLEMVIGGKWLAWIGAIVVLLAVAFAIMVGVERGWWGRLSPSTKCISIAFLGFLLIAGGEIALRRIGKAASVGLFSAGLGTLYLDSFAAFQPFRLISELGAFPLLAVVALIGFAITIRTSFLTIGVLSLIGGYLAPLLLWESSATSMRVPLFLTMLLGIALGLSAFRPAPFRTLRYFALGGQLTLGLNWIIAEGSAVWKPAMVFFCIWMAMLLAETIYAALREQSTVGNVVATFLATAGFVTAGCWLLYRFQPAGFNWMGAFTASVAVINAVAALQFGPGLDGLRGITRTAMDRLAIALWIQTGALVITAVALHFDGFGQSVSWLVIGLAAVEIGRRLPSRGVSFFGLISGAIATARVCIIDSWRGGMSQTIFELGPVDITRWAILALFTIIVIHLAAHRWGEGSRATSRAMPVILASIGTLLWLAWCARQCEGMATTAGWLAGAVALLALERFGRRALYFELGLLTLLLTAGRWLALDAIATRTSRAWRATDALPLLNWQMALAVAIAATGWWAYRILLRRQAERAETSRRPFEVGIANQVVLLIGFLLALIALSFEADRTIERLAAASSNLWWSVAHVRQVVLTMLWTLGSSGLGVFALMTRVRSGAQNRTNYPTSVLGRVAWAILILCAVKWVIGDTLLWAIAGRRAPILASTPLANLQMLAGVLLAAAAAVMLALRSAAAGNDEVTDDGLYEYRLPHQPSTWFDWVPVAASAVVLWGLTFEVDRMLGRLQSPPDWIATWPDLQARQLFWTMLWGTGGLAMIVIGQWRKLPTLMYGGWLLIAGSAVAWLTLGTLLWRLNDGANPAKFIFNLQFAAGICVGMLLIIATAWNLVVHREGKDDQPTHDARVSMGLLAAMGLWLGTLEIDRLFIDDPMARHTGYSVFWGIYAVMLVLIGFKTRSSAARYVGLGVLGVTLVKAFVIDMKEVDLLLKTLIFFVVGMLLIGTSILYIRLAPKLARQDANDAESD